MARQIRRSSTSNIIRFVLKNFATGMGLTGLTFSSSGLIISTICDNENVPTTYTVSAGTIENIAAIGTYVAPTATKCRFREVNSTNHPGLYEFHFADARFAVAGAQQLIISVSGATSLLDADYEIEIVATNSQETFGSQVLSGVIEGSITLKQALQVIMAHLAGKASGGGTTTLTFRDQADTKDRMIMTVDRNGNRSAITITYD